jgi:hypothetical protein
MRITVIRGIAGEFHFGVATRHCVVTIVSSFKVEPSVSQDIMTCDGYIASSATTWCGNLLVPQVDVAGGGVLNTCGERTASYCTIAATAA